MLRGLLATTFTFYADVVCYKHIIQYVGCGHLMCILKTLVQHLPYQRKVSQGFTAKV